MTPDPVVTLVPGKTDAELVAEFKRRIVAALEGVLPIMDEAKAAGFETHFSLSPNWTGRIGIAALTLVRTF